MMKWLYILGIILVLGFGTTYLYALRGGNETITAYDTECYYNDKAIAYEDLTYSDIFEDNNLSSFIERTSISNQYGYSNSIILPIDYNYNGHTFYTYVYSDFNYNVKFGVRHSTLLDNVSITPEYFTNYTYTNNYLMSYFTKNVDLNGMKIDVEHSNNANTVSISIMGYIVLDLTNIFGIGNEPTKEQMNAMLGVYLDKQGEKTMCDYDEVQGKEIGDNFISGMLQTVKNPVRKLGDFLDLAVQPLKNNLSKVSETLFAYSLGATAKVLDTIQNAIMDIVDFVSDIKEGFIEFSVNVARFFEAFNLDNFKDFKWDWKWLIPRFV